MTISPPGRALPGRVSGRAAAAAELPAEPADLRPLLAALTLAAKVTLLTGADSWRTHACPADRAGPDGHLRRPGRRPRHDQGRAQTVHQHARARPRSRATWDAELVDQLAARAGGRRRAARASTSCSRPTVNLVRTPLGGRGFEFFAEDPVLTARLATAYVRGVQSAGVAVTVKHYVGNDSETDRWTYDARIDEADAARGLPAALRGLRPRGAAPG